MADSNEDFVLPSGITYQQIEKNLESAIKLVSEDIGVVLRNELIRTLESKAIIAYLDKGIINYLVAAGALALAGRDIEEESVSRLLNSVGISIDYNMMSLFLSLHFRNHIVYVAAAYLLLILRKELSLENLTKVIRSMDIHPEASTANDVIKIVMERQAALFQH